MKATSMLSVLILFVFFFFVIGIFFLRCVEFGIFFHQVNQDLSKSTIAGSSQRIKEAEERANNSHFSLVVFFFSIFFSCSNACSMILLGEKKKKDFRNKRFLFFLEKQPCLKREGYKEWNYFFLFFFFFLD